MAVLKNRECALCGKKFDVKLGAAGRIPKQYFFSRKIGRSIGRLEYWECDACTKQGAIK